MLLLCLLLIAVALCISLPATVAARAIGHRLHALDGAGVPGQIKAAPRRVPNTGGIAIFLGIGLPMLGGLALGWGLLGESPSPVSLFEPLREHWPGIRARTTDAGVLLAGLALLHLMGLVDDRRPLGPYLKLVVMLGVAAFVAWRTETRLLMLLDVYPGGRWLSLALTVLWLGVVTNAFNFLDNMDGLSAGVAAVASAFFLLAAMINQQWFVGACLALLLGSVLGFLWFNFPRRGGATIFMGDSGSLVVGFLLGFLTARTTYYDPEAGIGEGLGGGWYVVFMPLVVLAVPLYDFVSVSLIRLWQGRSPFVGDLQHLSHRLVRRGLSKRAAVVVIYGLTAVTAIGGVSLGRLEAWQAVLVGVQTGLVLMVLAIEEYAGARERSRRMAAPAKTETEEIAAAASVEGPSA